MLSCSAHLATPPPSRGMHACCRQAGRRAASGLSGLPEAALVQRLAHAACMLGKQPLQQQAEVCSPLHTRVLVPACLAR